MGNTWSQLQVERSKKVKFLTVKQTSMKTTPPHGGYQLCNTS